MSKSLSQLTNEELWELFPIVLCEHNPTWKEKYLEEKKLLETIIGNQHIVRINHYGSTSVEGLIAKPTVDILLEIKENTNLELLVETLTANGYNYSNQPMNPPPHMMFMKGYTIHGFLGQVYHLHIRYSGDWNELYFRDYLKEHKSIANEYGKLKSELKEKYEHDRDGYTDAKSEFIKKITELAKKEYEGRYKLEIMRGE